MSDRASSVLLNKPPFRDHGNEVSHLLEKVVASGYCIGCGVCASIPDSPIGVGMNKYGCLQANLSAASTEEVMPTSVLAVCPFSGVSPSEDMVAREIFGAYASYDESIGFYTDTYAGYVIEDGYRERGSSGGMGSWILAQLLKRGLIDGALHVCKPERTEGDERLFQYHISTSVEEIHAGAKSRYYPVELSEVLHTVRQQPGCYALVGVPCFIRAVRLLAQEDVTIRDRIAFYIGLVCGHLKSTRFSGLFGWQVGIEPESLSEIDFRVKLTDQRTNRYGVRISGLADGRERTLVKPSHEFFGSLWGLGFFKYEACDYCDDVVAETADMTIGDAWLPQYLHENKGTNILVVRHPVFREIVQDGIETRRLYLDHIGVDEIVQSQAAGFRHKRAGLAYRLYLKDQTKAWRPQKRVEAQANHLDDRRKKLTEYRMFLTANSHRAFIEALEAGSFATFREQMEPLVQTYNGLYRSDWRRWAIRGKRLVGRVLGRKTG